MLIVIFNFHYIFTYYTGQSHPPTFFQPPMGLCPVIHYAYQKTSISLTTYTPP